MSWPQIGAQFEGFRLDAIVGEGGSATVYDAFDAQTQRRVALKILKPPKTGTYPDDVRARFEREVGLLSTLRNPHSVTLISHGDAAGLLYVAFEYVPGRDLSDVLREQKRLPPHIVAHILDQLLLALDEAHRVGILHRDLKPENIRVFDAGGDPWHVKLLDFGVARSVDEAHVVTQAGHLVGTPRYMSPEQLRDKALGPASDIYSLGLVGFEMLAGHDAMHGGEWGDQLERLDTGHVFAIPDAGSLTHVLHRMTTADPRARYQSAASVLTDLRRPHQPPVAAAHRAAAVASPRRTTEQSPPAEPASATTRLWIAGLLVVAVVGTFAVLALTRNDAPQKRVPPRRVADPSALVKGGTPPTPRADSSKATDAGATEAAGCGTDPGWRTSRRQLQQGYGARRGWFVHLPETYDANRRYPLVVLLHGNRDDYVEFATKGGFAALSDSSGDFVVISIDDGETRVWEDDNDALDIDKIFAETKQTLCIDSERVFVVAHGVAGVMAERLACAGWPRGLALSSYPRVPRERGCALPTIELAPTKSRHMWSDGTDPLSDMLCHSGLPMTPGQRKIVFKARNRCGSGEEPVPAENATCHAWDCEVPFVACELDGGHAWPGLEQAEDRGGCDGGPPADFPATERVWAFFDAIKPPSAAVSPDAGTAP